MKFLRKLFSKSLDEALDQTIDVQVRGVWFNIRKLDILDHLHGAQVLTESYSAMSIETRGGKNLHGPSKDKIKQHYRDVFTQCVVDPVLVRKEEDSGPGKVWVDRLFLDWGLAVELYEEIMGHTYGKKKLRRRLLASQRNP